MREIKVRDTPKKTTAIKVLCFAAIQVKKETVNKNANLLT